MYEFTFDAARGTLELRRGAIRASLQTTPHIARGLIEKLGVLTVDGRPYRDAKPMATVVDGVTNIAVGTVAAALLSAPAYWHADEKVIEIRTQGA